MRTQEQERGGSKSHAFLGLGVARLQECPILGLIGQVLMGLGAQMLLPRVACPWGEASSDVCPLGNVA